MLKITRCEIDRDYRSFTRQSITEDKAEADLLIVIGSSLKVRPVALIPSSLPENVPQVDIVIMNLKNSHCTS